MLNQSKVYTLMDQPVPKAAQTADSLAKVYNFHMPGKGVSWTFSPLIPTRNAVSHLSHNFSIVCHLEAQFPPKFMQFAFKGYLSILPSVSSLPKIILDPLSEFLFS